MNGPEGYPIQRAGRVHVEIVCPGASTAAVFPDPPPKPAGTTKIKKFLLRFGRGTFV